MTTTSLSSAAGTLRAALSYDPVPLSFGTSGRRGLVVNLTQLEIYINASAELAYLQSLPLEAGGIVRGEPFYYACDLRPSSSAYVPAQGGRGELAQAIEQAISDAGMVPVNLGQIPTPALTSYAIERRKGSIMITGSHIPFDRNGYKTNSSRGELLKKDEAPIGALVEQVRARVYGESFATSRFRADGLFKGGHRQLKAEDGAARQAYVKRYVDFFGEGSLVGLRLLAYQHSAVGRDLLVELLSALGAEVIPAGRSETFVPIDTEAIDAAQLEVIQRLADEAYCKHGQIDAVVSTDGDSDRPLVLGVEAEGKVRFFGGDLLGMVVAAFLRVDAVVVPISCNDAIDRGELAPMLEPKTKIGSPFVVAGMEAAIANGKRNVVGWEANGGFLTGSDITLDGRVLRALPTRDAMLPILATLVAARKSHRSVCELFEKLPRRFSKAALLRNFPRSVALKIVAALSPPAADVKQRLAVFFTPALGFPDVDRVDYTDGVRVYFANGDVAHIRPSGNADELRIYAVADSQQRAEAICAAGVAEPDGILRRMEKAVGLPH